MTFLLQLALGVWVFMAGTAVWENLPTMELLLRSVGLVILVFLVEELMLHVVGNYPIAVAIFTATVVTIWASGRVKQSSPVEDYPN